MCCLSFFQKENLNEQTLKSSIQINTAAIVAKGCISEVDLEYPKELRELHDDYHQLKIKQKLKKK